MLNDNRISISKMQLPFIYTLNAFLSALPPTIATTHHTNHSSHLSHLKT